MPPASVVFRSSCQPKSSVQSTHDSTTARLAAGLPSTPFTCIRHLGAAKNSLATTASLPALIGRHHKQSPSNKIERVPKLHSSLGFSDRIQQSLDHQP